MKNILKTGPVAVFILGDHYMIIGDPEVSDWDLLQAMDAEEELQLYRKKAETN